MPLGPIRDPLPGADGMGLARRWADLQADTEAALRRQPSAAPVASNITPTAPGVEHPGLSDELSRADHVHGTASAGARTGRFAVYVDSFFVVDVGAWPPNPGGIPPLGIVSAATHSAYYDTGTPGSPMPPEGWAFPSGATCTYSNMTSGDRSATVTIGLAYNINDNDRPYALFLTLSGVPETDRHGYTHWLPPSTSVGPDGQLLGEDGQSFTYRLIVRAWSTMTLTLSLAP
jgi:hypothetical protein